MPRRKKKDGRLRSQRKMSRRKIPPGRGVFPDPHYGSVLISKFINCLMLEGKKSVASTIFYRAMDIASKDIDGVEPLEIFAQAVENVKPALEVKSRRVGGANYQVPIEVSPQRQQALAIRWLVLNSRSRKERTMVERLAHEIKEAYNNTGGAVKKKEEVHRMADANKAFAHYRW